MMLAELAQQAGVPDGVLNVIHGAKESVDFVCDNPHIQAVSFVGSDFVGKYIYERGSRNGKRVQSNMVRSYCNIVSTIIKPNSLKKYID